MSFLVLDEGNIVTCTKEGQSHPDVKSLIELTSRIKDFTFENVITYIYHTYHKSSVYRNYPFPRRAQQVCKIYLANKNYLDFEQHQEVVTVIDLFKETMYTESEKFAQSLLNKIEELKEHLSSISFFKEVKIEIDQEVELTVTGPDDKEYEIQIPVKKKVLVKIDNSDEVMKTFEKSQKLFGYEDQLKQRLEVELMTKKSKKRLFDEK